MLYHKYIDIKKAGFEAGLWGGLLTEYLKFKTQRYKIITPSLREIKVFCYQGAHIVGI